MTVCGVWWGGATSETAKMATNKQYRQDFKVQAVKLALLEEHDADERVVLAERQDVSAPHPKKGKRI